MAKIQNKYEKHSFLVEYLQNDRELGCFFPAIFPITPDFFPVFPRNIPCSGENLQNAPFVLYLCIVKTRGRRWLA